MASTRKTVLITGCRGIGIGNALAREFHAQGFRVFATARSASQLEDLTALGIEAITLDVTSREQIAAAATEVASRTGGILDILVNNAGKTCTIPALDATDEDIKGVFETNFFSVVYVCQGFAPLVIKAKGTIVQIGSITQMVPLTFGSLYNATKAALHAFTDTLRVELEPFGVNVTEIITGGVKSNIAGDSKRRLPPTSIYMPIEDAYIARQGTSQVGALATAAYAKGVVKQVSKSTPPKWYWRGSFVWPIWVITTFFSRGFMHYIRRNTFGMDKLRGLVSSGKIKV